MMISFSSTSTEYVKVAVTATINGAVANPTTDTITMAFVRPGTSPGPTDFKTGSWETSGTTYYARCLIGPSGAVTLTTGEYAVWVKVVDSPEIPILYCGQIEVV